jgi:hypothetical protein
MIDKKYLYTGNSPDPKPATPIPHPAHFHNENWVSAGELPELTFLARYRPKVKTMRDNAHVLFESFAGEPPYRPGPARMPSGRKTMALVLQNSLTGQLWLERPCPERYPCDKKLRERMSEDEFRLAKVTGWLDFTGVK